MSSPPMADSATDRHLHILGICGTFMGGVAALARELGYRVTGSDQNVYPPMSTQLEALGIELTEGWEADQLDPAPDEVVVGNAMTRGKPVVEALLEGAIPYTSGPAWLARALLRDRWVIAVAGTHGKTTTAGMVAWILEYAGLAPGFLIGGVPGNFPVSARLGETPFFVIEADEYDSAFFDKRSKFVHYAPRTAILNNLEFDHADIFDDLAAIQRQFHHLVRTIPASGLIIRPRDCPALDETLAMGYWTPTLSVNDPAQGVAASNESEGATAFDVTVAGEAVGRVSWSMRGVHNRDNALAAIAAARHAGVAPAVAVEALSRFKGMRRRLESLGEINGIQLYDDFAHHPTAIRTTLEALPPGRRIAVLEPRSNSMRMGAHREALPEALALADQVYLYVPAHLEWDGRRLEAVLGSRLKVARESQALLEWLPKELQAGDQVAIMSNGGFEGIHQKLVHLLQERSNHG
ncbi:UDP-N-acetylmuramate: L-alanyl-gamma-D-glutamyl-meso-diaminopimelate ligase [Natronospira proteinivora]|uniref:UDP-N-acetylmuramate--L-alanyl-gamma-D-glutamyl-meso-2,6-diaminoheptandioate ligase n=1 Tax=Natronospira proteinivora TaxID=1807133 RepID=A0ABT1G411_9GAMM|nr:UDP-N-acetylmuramate:L-alanyl-gamma-D-glutamyl-meso-diaminopimelate ligase [Natronospira proteinivora]MCP1726039.1 UDP-N-acetylmuramate: L-alanyl-gamma-D-glutamyl-meso-diaminopimelate ligase [Natronospira proteinivora]